MADDILTIGLKIRPFSYTFDTEAEHWRLCRARDEGGVELYDLKFKKERTAQIVADLFNRQLKHEAQKALADLLAERGV